MATFNTAFGSLPGYREMLGLSNTTGGGLQQQEVYGQRAQRQRTAPQMDAQGQQQPAPSKTFAQMQREGMARPAPPGGVGGAKPLEAKTLTTYGGSQQATTMRNALADQLKSFGETPSRFDTEAFKKIREAQAANLKSDFENQQRQLNEDLARRGLSASNIAGSGLARLGGAQSRALADLDAQLLQRAAETQAQDRAQLLQSGQGFAELAGSQDLATNEAIRQAEMGNFENALRLEQFRQQQYQASGDEAFRAAQAEEAAQQAARQFDLAATGQTGQLSLDLQRLLGQQDIDVAQLTGTLGTGATAPQTLQARQVASQERQLAFQNAQRLSEQSGIQYTVDATGNVVPLRDAAGNPVRTSEETRAAEALRLQEAGVFGSAGTGTAQRLTQEALQNAYARSAQLSQITGQQYDVNPQTGAITLRTGTGGAPVGTLAADLQRAELTGTLGGSATLSRLQQNLQNAQIMSQITGRQYTVDSNGALVVGGSGAGITEAARQFDAEQRVRASLGLTESSGFVYNPFTGQLEMQGSKPMETVQGQIGRSQTLLALAQALGNLTPEQIANLFGKGGSTSTTTTTTPPVGSDPTTPRDGASRGNPPSGGANLPVGQVFTDRWGFVWVKSATGWTLRSSPADNDGRGNSLNPTDTGNTTNINNPPPSGSTEPLVPSWAIPPLGAQFEGQYAVNPNLGGSGYMVYRGGQWRIASTPPNLVSAPSPAGGNINNLYPGYTIFSNNQRLVWNGASWIPA